MHDASLPDQAGADLGQLDRRGLDTQVSDSGVTDTGLADSTAVDSSIADAVVVDLGAADTRVVDSSPGDNTAPDSAAPDMAAPDMAAPDMAAPDLTAPDLTAPDLAAPDLAAPDLAAPDLTAPDLAAPDLAAPDLAAPDSAQPCGDGEITPPEVCDDDNLAGETCLSLGLLQGAGDGLACEDGCTDFDVSGCTGGPISCGTGIQAALEEAYATDGHDVISVQPGQCAETSAVTLDECASVCIGPTRYGVTLRPLRGPVVFDLGGSTQPMFEVVTGNNNIEGFQLIDADDGILLSAGTDAGGNRVSHNLFANNPGETPHELVRVESDDNTIVANFFKNASGVEGQHAIYVSGGQRCIVSMNVITGPFTFSLGGRDLGQTVGDMTYLDHNSILIEGSPGAGGVRLRNASGVCYRNNIVYGDLQSTGLDLNDSPMEFGTEAQCGGSASLNNVNLNHQDACLGSVCAALCTGGGPLCDRLEDPNLDPGLCLTPNANPLINDGVDLGYDMWDGSIELFNGAGPEVGAREDGVARIYGGIMESCPR